MTNQTNFSAYAVTSQGTNVVQVSATDLDLNTSNANYQLVVTNASVSRTLSYDANGNLTNSAASTATNSYEWDAADRLAAFVSGTNRSEFTYDGAGRRVKIVEKTNGVVQTTKTFVWCGSELCEERDATGTNVTKRFFPQGEQISGTNYYFTRDHLGSVREMVDSSATIHARYDYDPYGRKTKASGDMDADFGFTGHYNHSVSGLYLTLYRAYDSETGRWIRRDAAGEMAGNNLYNYVLSDPVNSTDQLGLWNYWNPLTWGVPNGIGWSWYDSFNPFHESNGFSLLTTSEATAAFLDGVNPFGNPFANMGLYDPCDKSLQWSKRIGGWTRVIEIAIATAGGTAEAATANKIGLQVSKNSWVKDNLFRWGYGKWGNPVEEGLHFHLGPVMKYHLPYQAETWFYHSAAVAEKFLENIASKWTPLF